MENLIQKSYGIPKISLAVLGLIYWTLASDGVMLSLSSQA